MFKPNWIKAIMSLKKKEKSVMNYELAYSLLSKIYCNVLKEEVQRLVSKTDSKVDDVVAGVLDTIFSCEKKK